MVSVRSCTSVSFTLLGSARSSRGSSALRRSTVSMTLAPGWRCTSMMTAGVPWYQPPTRAFSRPSSTRRHVLEAHGRGVAEGDDDLAIGLGRGDLVVGGDGVALVRAVERTLRAGDVGRRNGAVEVGDRQPVGGEASHVGLDAHGRANAALDRNMADAGHRRQALGDERIGEVAQVAHRDDVGCERQGDDGRVGRVHLGVGRRVRQVARQRRAGRVDRRLHVLRRGIDVAPEIELQRDLAEPVRARRGHGRQRRDLPELALQRGGDQRRHGLRIGAG